MSKKLHIKTYGCQMNVYDSARMAEVLAPLGYGPTDSATDADMILLNTCHIREKAAEKVYSELGRLNALKRQHELEGRRLILGVAGCVAQAEGEEMLRRAPYLDLVVGPQAYHRLPEMVARLSRAAGAALDTDFPARSKFDFLPEQRRPAGRGAAAGFVTVQEGCDKFCTFCVVPYTRGAESSRPASSVLAEVRALAERGVVEATLLGQNVNNYRGAAPHGGVWDLAALIEAVAGIAGIRRIRYTTSYPAEMNAALIAAHRDVPKLMPYLHLPVQSGSDRMLAAMNRRHTAEDYRGLAERLRAARPDLALSSDFIVGFPGETAADFEATLRLVRDIGFAQAYSFKYSPRPGTPAAEMEAQIPESEKEDRLAALQELLGTQQRAFNLASAGRTLPILFERSGRRPGQLIGRSPYMQAVHADASESLIGAIAEVRIARAGRNSLAGIVVVPPVSGPGAGAPIPRMAERPTGGCECESISP